MKQFRTYEMALKFYREAKDLTLDGEMKDQFDRALLSVTLNLAEGSAKPTRKDRAKFYYTALGSLREVQTILLLIENHRLTERADQLGGMIYRLSKNPGGS